MILPHFGLFLLVEFLAASPGVSSMEASDRPLRIYGGEIVKVCEFPTTIAGRDACTATLVHPRVVLSAAHCGRHREFLIGEYKTKAAKRIKAKWCETGPVDAQICVLAEPMLGVPVAPIIQGCESEALKAGTSILLAGYGYDEKDPVGDGSVRDEKRWVETKIFRVTGSELHVGGGGKTACNGDSGGPAFLKLKDGTWRTVGATYAALTGGAHPNCKTASYKRTDKMLGWYQRQLDKHNEKDIDLSPCFDDSGAWKPTKDCGGYTKDVQGPYGAWDNNCGKGVPVVKYSATCGEPFAPNDEDDEEESSFSVSFARSSGKASIAQGESITLKAKLPDEDEVKFVVLRVDDKAQEKKSSPPFSWTLEDLDTGRYTLELHAQSKSGDKAQSDKLTLNVTEEGQEEPSSETSSDDDSTGEESSSEPSSDEGSEGTPKAEESPDISEDASPNASGDTPNKRKGGCSLEDASPAMCWAWLLIGLGLFRRREG